MSIPIRQCRSTTPWSACTPAFLIGRVEGHVDPGLLGWSQGLAQDIEGCGDPPDLRGERLKINFVHNWQILGPSCCDAHRLDQGPQEKDESR